MRGALYITSGRTPYRRGGLSFPVASPLTIAIASLAAVQLQQLVTDPLITVMVGQDDGRFIRVPELNGASLAELQAFIDAAPEVEIEAAQAASAEQPSGLQAELDDVRKALEDVNGQLSSAQSELSSLRQANIALVQDRDSALGQVSTLQAAHRQLGADLDAAEKAASDRKARIAELESELAEAKKPTTKTVAKTKTDT